MKSTKRSLFASVLALVLCVCMLLGTTWAWFTDEVQSGVNQIVAGNLDVELYAGNEKVTEATKLFDDVTLWEPGAYCYETFTIKNVGNLAFKYSMLINAYNATVVNGHSLDEVLKVAVVDTAPTSRQTYSNAVPLKNWSLGETEKPLYPVSNPVDTSKPSEKTFTVVVYWEPTDNDNQWNMNNANREAGKVLSVDLGVTLVATQLTYEKDSFDDQYDATAAIDMPFAPMTKKLADSESLKIVVPEDAESSVKEATVPAKVANAVFEKVFKDSTATDKSLTLVLNVEEKSKNDTTFNYEIDMDAVIKELTDGVVTKSETKSVNKLGLNFTDFVEVQMNIDSDLSNVKVKHNGEDMTAVAGKEAIEVDNNPAGYFNYAKDSGLTKLWIKSFSPFVVTGEKEPDPLVLTLTGQGMVSGEIGGHTFILSFPTNNQIAQGHTSASLTITEVKEADANKAWKVTYPIGIKYYTFVMDDGYGTDDPSANIYVKDATEVIAGANTVMYESGYGFPCTVPGFEGDYYMIGAICNR